ncbi:T9SS C-terminal target domain-containing protein [Maribacter algicola]|uniref:T9SS C-terminal target domain-containing protein n=1 Tax=Maribacter algicola TaxID=2498892 RepID=A0A3R8S122_9FLAO|nr:zinc-dependent metalloprotease family protein [Maribacter algicola]RRQ49655.1 T9SS C-terminal target domain-containing protein [Maribacter algicola]
MTAKLRLVFSITIAFLSFSGLAQTKYWGKVDLKNQDRQVTLKRLDIHKAKAFTLDEAALKSELLGVSRAKSMTKTLYFPDDEGNLIPFQVAESQLFAPGLAQKYPTIKSYRGKSVEADGKKIFFSLSSKGLQTMIMDPKKEGTVYMEKGASGDYIIYNAKDHLTQKLDFVCKTSPDSFTSMLGSSTAKLVDDQSLRKFRVAIAASGEYTQFHGGTIADALAAINATLTRVNGVFERDLGVTLELIANTDQVIYTNPDTDPFSGGLSSQTQNTLTSVIGEANYDIGHLFNQQDGTLDGNSGFIGSVCQDNRKGSAYTTLFLPQGDQFDIDLVAHEMGHQFGANHTFSHLSEGTLVQVEPGSGTTIMGYAGITGNNDVATNSDDYFHYVSIVQVREYLQTISCGETIPLANNAPILNPVSNYTIPIGTAFVLTGSASDPDTTDVLTYDWEQIDNGIVTQATFGPNNPTGAMFRSLPPSISPERYFPRLSRVVSGDLTQTTPVEGGAWETVSNVQRDLNFSLTVRDNVLNGGQSASDEVTVSVFREAGPFVVTSQESSVSFVAGETETITWDVANTNVLPIGAQNVDIFLSTDGGFSFPNLIAQNVTNDGSHAIVIPGGYSTTSGRFMVKAANNIFFSVNQADFSITESEVVLNFDNLNYEVCKPDDLIVSFNYETYLGFTEESTLSVGSLPPGVTATFSQDTVSVSNTPIDLTFSGTSNLAIGSYSVDIVATAASITKSTTVQLNVYDTNFSEIVLTAPSDGSLDVSKDVLLEWEPDLVSTSYDVEIATDVGFATIIESKTVATNSYQPSLLLNETQYFWRVKPKNTCGEGVFGTTFSFTTIQFNCITKASNNVPITISPVGTPTITSRILFYQDLNLADINVNLDIEHTYLSDLVISLTSPSGTTVVLVSSACGNNSDINAIFDDEAANAFICLGSPAISGTVRPIGTLSSFYGESILGEWVLEIQDNAASDGGRLNNFSLEVCVEGDFRPDADQDGVFDDGEDLCLDTPLGQEVDASGCAIYRFTQENFNVSLESETCRPNNDGAIRIVPKVFLDYEITINGNGVNIIDNFTNSFNLTDLGAGTYDICITGTDGTISYEPFCLEVVITEPAPLNVTSKVSLQASQIVLDLQGAKGYYVELNGYTSYTADDQFTVDLSKGINFLKVYTDIPCQGIYEEEIVLSEGPLVFPNPFHDFIEIYFDVPTQRATIMLFSSDGRLLRTDKIQDGISSKEYDLSILPVGMYYLQYDSRGTKKTTKILKR